MESLPMSVTYGGDNAPNQDDEAEIAALEAKLAPAIKAQKDAQARLQAAQLGQGLLGIESAVSAPFSKNLSATAGQQLVSNAQNNLGIANDAVAQLVAQKNKAVAESPNSARAKALQAAVARLGGNASGLSAQDINANNLLAQEYVSRRADAEVKARADRADADREFNERKLALAMQRASLGKSGAKSGSGGGSVGSDPRKNEEWLYQAAGGDNVSPETREFNKQSILALDRKSLGQFMGANAKQIDDRIMKAKDKEASDAQKLQLTISKTAEDLGKQRSKLGIDDDVKFIDDAIANVNANADDFKAYLAFPRGKEGYERAKAFFGDEKAAALQAKYNELKRTVENYARARSGAAISKQEWANFKEQLGSGAFASPKELVAGLERLKKSAELKDKSLFAGYKDAGKVYAQTLVGQGVRTPWLKEIAASSKPQGQTVAVPQANRVKVIKVETGLPVTLPQEQVEAGIASGKYRLP